MKREIMIKAESEKYRTLKNLRECLSLPEDIVVSDEELVNFIDNMKNSDYKEIITFRYILGYSFKKVSDTIDLYYDDLQCLCKTAVKNLRKDIINYYHPVDLNDLPVSDIVWHKISNRLGLSGKTVRDAKEWLLTYEYVPSKDVDTLVEAIGNLDPDFNYPKFLLHRPQYPYNLYSFLLKERHNKKITAKELYSKYMRKMIRHPSENFNAYYIHADEIFSDNNLYMKLFLNDRELTFTKMYFKDNLKAQEISRILSVPASTIKAAVYKFIDLLNSDIGTYYIHQGFPIK